MPTAALKRFANDLEHEGESNKFLQINKERVSDFVKKFPDNKLNETDGDKNALGSKSVIAHGIYEYPQEKFHSTLQLQSSPEFSPALGFRSRFGDGDGSFFDRWLVAGIVESKRLVDKRGLPVTK